MKGNFIYIVKTDRDGPERGKYVQATLMVFPTRGEAVRCAAGASPSRKTIVVELLEPVEIDSRFYPVRGQEWN